MKHVLLATLLVGALVLAGCSSTNAPPQTSNAGTQPAGRPPAPGRLAFVQTFLNTFWDLDGDGAEAWGSPGAYGAWLRARGFGVAPSGGDLDRALELREALRALCRANHDDGEDPAALATLDRIARAVAPAAALAPSLRTGALEPAGDGPDAACALALGIVFAARADRSTLSRTTSAKERSCRTAKSRRRRIWLSVN